MKDNEFQNMFSIIFGFGVAMFSIEYSIHVLYFLSWGLICIGFYNNHNDLRKAYKK